MSLSRRLRSAWFRRALIFLSVAWLFLDFVRFHSYRLSQPRPLPSTSASAQKIFIASTHWNNEPVLKNYWNKAVLDLVRHFGPNNTFVSIYESGSWDNSKAALRELKAELDSIKVGNEVVLDPTTHDDEIAKPPAETGWIDTARGRKELRRIPYLSRLRNLSLEPFHALARKGVYFDKILFLNDVVFSTEDVTTLLVTRDGDYAAACALDFSKPPNYYDTFALRDLEGHEAVMSTWPYFRSYVSRSALKRGDPVPVSSCWNGMVFMQASPFYDEKRPLSFRGIPDSLASSHLEGSECCLIHQDNTLTPRYGVYVNPHVRVGYNKEAYDVMHGSGQHLSLFTYLSRVWENRLKRWFTTDWFKTKVVRNRLNRWQELDHDHVEAGIDCLINEMQVLVGNGWAHV